MKTFACVVCAALIGLVALPRALHALAGFQAELRENLACTAAFYAALDSDATAADFDRADVLCPDDPGLPERSSEAEQLRVG